MTGIGIDLPPALILMNNEFCLCVCQSLSFPLPVVKLPSLNFVGCPSNTIYLSRPSYGFGSSSVIAVRPFRCLVDPGVNI